ncbi:hypothetical protein Tco_1181458, partial [Tanacetum coccineum]
DGRVIVQNVQGRHSEGYTGNAGKEQMNENNKSNKDRIEIDAEKHDFLANGLEGFDSDCEDLQLNATSILTTKKVEAYDSDCDDTPTTSAIFMAKLSPVGSLNGDEAGHSSNSDILSKVPNYDNYHENDMINSFVQELLASEQSVYVNHISKQAYWLPVSKPALVNDKPETIVPKLLPKTSKVKTFFQQANYQLDTFDKLIKEKLTINVFNEGYFGVHHVKRAYDSDVRLLVAELRDSLTKFEPVTKRF